MSLGLLFLIVGVKKISLKSKIIFISELNRAELIQPCGREIMILILYILEVRCRSFLLLEEIAISFQLEELNFMEFGLIINYEMILKIMRYKILRKNKIYKFDKDVQKLNK